MCNRSQEDEGRSDFRTFKARRFIVAVNFLVFDLPSIVGTRRRPCGESPNVGRRYSVAITRVVNDLVTSVGGSIFVEHGIGIEKLTSWHTTAR